MKESLQNIGDLIAEPSAAFSRLKSQPRSGIAFIVFYLFSVLIGWAILPYTKVLSTAQLVKQGLQPGQLEAAGNIGQIFESIGIFIGPIFAIVMFVIISAVLKLAARFLVEDDMLGFRHIYAAVVHIALIGCLIQLVNTALLLVFKDIEGIKSAAELKMIPGLHLLFAAMLEGQVNPKLMMFLGHINPLSLWLIIVMAIAIVVLADVEKNKARVAAVILWVISILPEVVFAT
ncbi:MAG: YIP1 family protein [Candidatus Poribacteria bacterium]|nr:YIP1 family protein [Candidatus Poribacteria bacterium]